MDRHPWLVAVLFILAAGASMPAANAPEPDVAVQEQSGTYMVSATFAVSQTPSAALAVLTDYEQIPRFMPGVRTSHLLERSGDRVVVEQEAIARFMMFSKTVHLVLEIEEQDGALRFHDRCGRSFSVYDGAWITNQQNGYTAITYQLAAKPSFDIPEFLLKRLMKRDATRMIEGLQREIDARAQ